MKEIEVMSSSFYIYTVWHFCDLCYLFRDIECDLNINNGVGIRNTHLLKYYCLGMYDNFFLFCVCMNIYCLWKLVCLNICLGTHNHFLSWYVWNIMVMVCMNIYCLGLFEYFLFWYLVCMNICLGMYQGFTLHTIVRFYVKFLSKMY